jgi:hypothetical protein
LDELIVLHVKAMAKKVDEIMTDERFQKGSREATSKLSFHRYFAQNSANLLPFPRRMAQRVHRSQPQAFNVRLLHQSQIPWIF